jgi:hypothetical protein
MPSAAKKITFSGSAGVVPMHAPDSQASIRVQESPSSQGVSSGTAGFEHAPVAGSQTPATWHGSSAEQTTGFPPRHAPAWQTSVLVQRFPSLHAAPLRSTVHDLVLTAGTQAWHELAGFVAPLRQNVPLILQPGWQTPPQPQSVPGQQSRS